MGKNEQVSQPRYRVVSDKPLYVTVQRQTGEDSTTIEGELLDISTSGVQLALMSPLQFGEEFLLHLASENIDFTTTVASRVQWIRAGRTETEWTLGCSYETDLQADVLEQLVELAFLERRDSYRQQVAIPVRAHWERIGDEESTEIRDISSGGFCVATKHDLEVGSSVCLRLGSNEGEHSLEGRITWQSTTDHGTLVGCQWKDRKGTDWFRSYTAAERSATTSTGPPPRRRSWLLLAVPALAFALGIQLGVYRLEIQKWVDTRLNPTQVTDR